MVIMSMFIVMIMLMLVIIIIDYYDYVVDDKEVSLVIIMDYDNINVDC